MILKYLDISTVHLSQNTIDDLEVNDADDIGTTVAQYREGFFISVPESISTLKCSNDLKAVLNYAAEKGCQAVRLDADGDIDPCLPEYEHQ